MSMKMITLSDFQIIISQTTEKFDIILFLFFFAVALRPNADHGLLILEVFLDHTQRRTTVGRTPLDE